MKPCILKFNILTQPDLGFQSGAVIEKRVEFKIFAFHFLDIHDPTYTWSGHLPPKIYKNPIYSNKVFLGGVPWDITEGIVLIAF